MVTTCYITRFSHHFLLEGRNMSKYIFVTGGVVSGLGKGLVAASLGRLLKERGFKVAAQKLDPYINVDPGTMSPLQHGEVYVTADGAETDLDLGHYERFINEDLNKYSNITTGKIYSSVIAKERKGEYLGSTVQVIPHITNEIKSFIYKVGSKTDADIVISEIGGTVGDIESTPFLEAARQVLVEVGSENCIFIHVVPIIYLSGSNELKTKPCQHSCKELQSLGIRPNIVVLRSDTKLDKHIIEKVSMFCNVSEDCVIENLTLPNIYEVPLALEKDHLSEVVLKELGMDAEAYPIDLDKWKKMVHKQNHPTKEVTIGLVGKYVALHDAYLSVVEALKHASYSCGAKLNIKWINSEKIDEDSFKDIDGLIVPGGFGKRGIEGMIKTCKYARMNNVPLLGICLGMQVMCIEFARDVLGYEDANSLEFDPKSKHQIINFMADQSDEIDKGGTLRLGNYPCMIKKNSVLYKTYKKDEIVERHRHRYEFNNEYREEFESNGLILSGTSPDGKLVECVEYPSNNYYVGAQFHPEFKSRPNKPHPLFVGLIKASLK